MRTAEFYNRIGKIALGSRLRMLSERITSEAADLYRLYGVALQPKWFPVFYVLSHSEGMTITDIAKEIGHSHPSVSKIVREMVKKDLVVETKDKADKRRNVVQLSDLGKSIIPKISVQYQDVNQALDQIFGQTSNNLWKAIDEFEYLLDQDSLQHRVQRIKKEREAQFIEVIDYTPEYAQVFKELNEHWIRKYFKIEAADTKALEHPQTSIIDKGGYIKIALYKKNPVGVCALQPIDHVPGFRYELAKMAVDPSAQGLGIGFILGQAIVDQTKMLGGKKLFLESNTILTPAIRLYEKLGFKKITGYESPYERSNIQMELILEE